MSLLIRNRISLLVCDMAGTVINENGIIYKSIENILSRLHVPTTEEERIRWPGKDKKEILTHHIKNHIKINEKNIIKTAEKWLIEDLTNQYLESNKAELMDPSLPTFFNKLQFNGIKIGLNTGYPATFQKTIIDHFDLNKCIDAHISSEKVKYGRPYPYMIHRLMEECSISNIKQVAKIGDTSNDMLEGRNAGCGLVIGVLSGASSETELRNAGADVILENITDLNKENIFNSIDDQTFLL